ncbi:serine hydrolase [Kocuria rosea]|uniref:serine hydrolase n=1 Tax=Kocuria rosea TaxID=1275 RepID=UPI002040FEEE|nr:serine hydrolase [Kocuria rosea]MCM3687654.1 class A beta-lactamase-related serine hydrolase [Kocuria rosea]
MQRSSRPSTHRRRPRGRRLAAVSVALALAAGGGVAGALAPAAAAEAPGPAAGPAAADPAAVRLETELQSLAAQVPGELGFVLLGPDGAPVLTHNADRSFTSASLYKLFVAHAVLDRVDRGLIALSDTVPGTSFTVEDAVRRTITWSDNVSGAALGRWLGWKEVEAFARASGFESTTYDPDAAGGIVHMTTTPDDVADLLQRLRTGELLSGPSGDLLLGFLTAQELTYALSTGLSADVEFAHKTGLLEQVSHDAGMVRQDGREHVVAVLTDGWSGYDDSKPWFQRMGRALDDYVHAAA